MLGHNACGYKNIEYNRDHDGVTSQPFFWHEMQCWGGGLQLHYFFFLTQISEGRHPAKLYAFTTA